ncbi:MAG: hypothetical protein JNL08_02340 [Planctomycetes bacterium]|nr:hypothetical protein [Planctomycetota bacterium]
MNTLLPILCAGTILVAAGAQQPMRQLAMDATIAGACGVARVDDTLTAVGPDYKARFRHGTIDFVPALGARAERCLTWSFRLTSIRRSATLVAGGTDAAEEPNLDGNRVSWVRDGVVECYDVRAEGLEQSFVFAARPAGTGDLVVHGEVTTELVPRPCGRQWLFECAGVGGVRLGEVVGIDAAGRRVVGTSRVLGSSVEYVLPAEFVDAAAYPLVLDPLIATELAVAPADSRLPDCAYDHTSKRWLVVWQQQFSLVDVDVRALRIDADTAMPIGAVVIVDAGPEPCTRPRVAGIAGVDRFLVVYQRSASLFGPFDVRACAVDAAGALASANSTLVSGLGQEPRPCVSGEASDQGDSGIVVLEDGGIRMLKVVVPTTGAAGLFASAMLTPSNFAREPAISRSGGVVGRHLVTWTEATFGSDTDVLARVVSRDLSLLTPLTVLMGSSTIDGQTAVDGDGTEFVVAHSRREPSGTLRDVRALRVEYAAGVLTLGTDQPIEATPNQDEFAPDIAWLGPKYCVAFVERQALLDDDACAWLIDASCTTCNARIRLQGVDGTANSNQEWAPRVAGRWAFAQNGFNDDGLIVSTESFTVPPFLGAVLAQRVQALGPGSQPVFLGGACGNGGVPAISAPFVVGNADFHFLVSGLEPGAVPVLDLGLPAVPLPCGACSLLPPVILEVKANVGGTASSLWAVPCDPGFAGFQLEFQWLSLLTSASPCSLLPGASLSERVALTAGI